MTGMEVVEVVEDILSDKLSIPCTEATSGYMGGGLASLSLEESPQGSIKVHSDATTEHSDRSVGFRVLGSRESVYLLSEAFHYR